MSLVAENVTFRRGEFSLSIPKLELLPGTLTVLTGKSGSGKTTVLHLIAGFLKPLSGEIRFGDKQLVELPPERRRIAMLLQNGALFPHMTVEENVAFSPTVQKLPREEITKRTEHYLGRLQISELARRYPHQISGGQAQRAALARALASGFPVLLLDEPFSSLDLELKRELYPVLKDLCQAENVAMCLVTHAKEDVEALADFLYRVENKAVVKLSK
jgi:ABC-type Fe3+/spermidine/putrescine transport system ATPase subunit